MRCRAWRRFARSGPSSARRLAGLPGSVQSGRPADRNRSRKGAWRSPSMEQGLVIIRKRGAARIRGGHVWIYRADILEEKEVQPGAIVVVQDERGTVVGKAFYSSQSQIALRFLSRGIGPTIDESFFRKRFDQADHLREQLGVDPRLSRRISSEGDFLPGLIVDRYEDYIVVQTLTQAAARLEPACRMIVQER